MYNIHADYRENCLYTTFTGIMNDDEVQRATDEIIAAVGKLRPEFTLINNMADFSFVSPQSFEYAQKAMKAIFQKRVKLVIRVGAKSVASMQFNRALQGLERHMRRSKFNRCKTLSVS